MEVVISFDDTGSMSSVRRQVIQKVEELVKMLLKLNPLIRIGIIIHNDYCDKDIIAHLDLTSDEKKIISFVNTKLDGYGGDADECYELALNYIHSKFNWATDKRIAILIGDCEPHKVGYKYGSFTNNLDWKEEAKKCIDKGIKLYPIQALGRSGTFYSTLASMNGTPRLELSQFAHINQYLAAVLYKEEDKLEEYENSQPEFKTNYQLKNMFAKLKGLTEVDTDDLKYDSSKEMVDLASRFQVLEVGPTPRVIRDFVEDNGATFKKGRGFYQFILTETIQENKEVIFVDKLTGECKSDIKWCREQLGVPLGTRGRVNPRSIPVTKQYDIFIQSTSYNRKLDPNTKFLYELEHK